MFTRLAPSAAGNPGLVAEVVQPARFLPLAISLLARVYTRHQSWTWKTWLLRPGRACSP
jgi:hypothetical protein